jgi:glycosyltransferase involved in cell wall biosynthesis
MASKTVILIPQFFREGATRQAFLLARELKFRHGLDIEVWALFYSGDCQKEFENAGFTTRVLGFRRPQCPISAVRTGYWVGRLLTIARRLRRQHVDILLPMTSWPNVISGLVYRLAGVRLCIWGERSAGVERVPREQFAARQYRSFVANATSGIDFLTADFGVARELISYVPDAVEEAILSGESDWRIRLGVAAQQAVVLKIANITRYRDHATLLRAWKIVQDDWRSELKPVLVLAGALGDSFREVQRIARDAALEPTVRFLGFVPNVSSLIGASDLAVFSSRKEGMPNSVLEYMAGGKAVVATDIPGIRDAIGPAADEVLVPAGDSEKLASRLLELLRDEGRRNALGEANRRRALSEFTVRRMVSGYLNAMEQYLRPSDVKTLPPVRQFRHL